MRGSRAWCDMVSILFSVPRGTMEGKKSSMKRARERSRGEITSENDDMSSDKECERHSRRKSKGSCLKLI